MGLLSELLPQAIAGRMQENHRNGQDDSDIVDTISESFTITRAALNSRLVTRGCAEGSNTLENFSLPLEKCVGHSLELLDTVQKFGPLLKTSSPPLLPGVQAGYKPVEQTHYFVRGL